MMKDDKRVDDEVDTLLQTALCLQNKQSKYKRSTYKCSVSHASQNIPHFFPPFLCFREPRQKECKQSCEKVRVGGAHLSEFFLVLRIYSKHFTKVSLRCIQKIHRKRLCILVYKLISPSWWHTWCTSQSKKLVCT